jgi:hypothetical protein
MLRVAEWRSSQSRSIQSNRIRNSGTDNINCLLADSLNRETSSPFFVKKSKLNAHTYFPCFQNRNIVSHANPCHSEIMTM